MSINHKQLLFGIATFIPGVKGRRPLTTGGTDTAEYCYSVWLRHLTLSVRHNLCQQVPGVVAEFGPGDSIGIGLAALISGASQYVGLDVIAHSTQQRNVAIFDKLVELYKKRAPIFHGPGFDQVKPMLDAYDFPYDILTEDRLNKALSEERLRKIRNDILAVNQPGSSIHYLVPWTKTGNLPCGPVDMIYSQAVMEYCEIYPQAYRKMFQWLKPSGFLSHQIDFRSHGTFSTWDGHWSCPDVVWQLMRGKRPYFISRATYSEHVKAMADAGFSIVQEQISTLSPTFPRKKLNSRFRLFNLKDLTVAGAFIQAKRAALTLTISLIPELSSMALTI